MITVIRADQRHFSDFGWLRTYWLFSFDEYYDPQNLHFGALRVFNDDTIDPGQGFPTHPHREMEIVTVILDGEITHEDTAGNRGLVKAGEVQRITTGRGVQHSEFNLGSKPLHLYQIWIFPRQKGVNPSYAQKAFSPSQWKNKLLALASGQGIAGALDLNADATIYRADFEAGHEHLYQVAPTRGLFIYLTSGELEAGDQTLLTNDQARISGENAVRLKAVEETSFVLIDVPM